MDAALSLRGIGVLSHLKPEQFEALASICWEQTYPVGDTVFKEGEPARELYAVLEGSVKVRRSTGLGNFPFAEVKAGEILGEANHFDGRPRPGEAVAAGKVEILAFDGNRLSALGEEDPRFELALLWAFWRSLASKLRASNERLKAFFEDEAMPAGAGASEPEPGSGDSSVNLAARKELFLEQRLSPMEINFLATLSQEERFAAGQPIFLDGEVAEKMYVVLGGEVMISKVIPGAGEEALAFLQRGDYFGEMGLIENQLRSATAKAHGEGAVVLSLSQEVVVGLLDIENVSSARLLRLLCTLLANRLYESDQKLVGWFLLSGGQMAGLEFD